MSKRSPLPNSGQYTGQSRWLLLFVVFTIFVGVALFSLQAGSSMPDLRDYPAGSERKSAFFDFARPLVEDENQRISQDRDRLVAIAADSPGFFDRRWLARLAEEYRIENPDPTDPDLVASLLVRVDTVPLSLALAQAAKESGWGTSRFAREGYNLFGEWCFNEGCGMVPRARPISSTYEVESFRSPRESVASYLHNLNTLPQYQTFRLKRAKLRAANDELSGIVLAEKLLQYSQRREAYVLEIQQLIRSNDLE